MYCERLIQRNEAEVNEKFGRQSIFAINPYLFNINYIRSWIESQFEYELKSDVHAEVAIAAEMQFAVKAAAEVAATAAAEAIAKFSLDLW